MILGSFWEPPWDPIWQPVATILGSGPVLEALGRHVGGILGPFGRLSVSTSFLEPKNDQKLSFFGVVDVVKT